jgi:hypothetical protein
MDIIDNMYANIDILRKIQMSRINNSSSISSMEEGEIETIKNEILSILKSNIDLKIVNDSMKNTYNNLIENKKYIIIIPRLFRILEAEIYFKAIRAVDFKINKDNGEIADYCIGYKYDHFDSIEYSEWDKYEKCYIFLVNN